MGINFGGGGSTKIQVTEEGTESDVSTTITPLFRGTINAGSWNVYDPAPSSQSLKNPEAAAMGDYLYILAGAGSTYGETTELWRYDPAQDSYTLLTDSEPQQYYRPGAMVSDGSALYSVGGYDRDAGNAHEEVYKYDPGSGWSQITTCPNPRMAPATAYYDGKIYLAAGDDGGFNATQTFQWYDIAADSWNTGPNVPVAVNNVGAGIGVGYMIVVGGGSSNDRTFLYEFSSGSWFEGATSKYAWDNSAAVWYNGKLYVGGSGDTNSATYDPETDTWSDLPDFNNNRGGGSGGVVNGQILFGPQQNESTIEGYTLPDTLFTAGVATRITNETSGTLRNKTTGKIGSTIYVRPGDEVVPGGGGEYDIYAQT